MAKSTDHFLVSLFREAGDPLAADRLIDFEQMYAGPDRFHPTHNIQSVADSEDAGDGAGDPMAGAGVSMPGGAGGMPPMGDPGLGAPGGQPPGDDQLTDMNTVGGDPNQQQPPPVQEARINERNQFWGGMAPRGVMGGPHMGGGFGGMMPPMFQQNPYMQQQNPDMQQQQQQPSYPRLPPVQPRSVPGVAPVTTPNPNDPAQVPQQTGSTLPGGITDDQFRQLPAAAQQAIAPNYKPKGMVTDLITRSSTEGGSDLQKKIDAEKAGGVPAAGAAGAPAAALPAVPAGEKGLTAEKPPVGSHDLWGQPAATAGHETLAGRMFRAVPDAYTDLSNMVTGNTANAATLPKGQAVGNAASALNGAPAANVAAPPNNTQTVVGDAGKQKMGEAMYDDIDEFLEEMLRIDEAPPYGAYAGTGGYGGPYPGGARPPGGAYYGGRMGPPGGMGGDPRMGGGGPQPYMGPAGGMMRSQGPIDYQGMRFGGPGQGGPSVAPQNYAGHDGPQAPPPSVQAGGPGAIRNWQQQMSAVGGGAGAVQGVGAPTRGSRAGGNRPAAAGGMNPSTPLSAGAPAAGGPNGAGPGQPDRVADARGPANRSSGDFDMAAGPLAGGVAGFAKGLANPRVPSFQVGRANQLTGGAGPSTSVADRIGRVATAAGNEPGGGLGARGAPAANGLWDQSGKFTGNLNQPGAGGARVAGVNPAAPAGGPAAAAAAPASNSVSNNGAANTNRATAIKGGNVGPAAGAADAAAGGESGVLSALGRGAGTAARVAGRAMPAVAGGLSAYDDYQQTGSIPHAAITGGGTAAGTGIGAALGAGLGALTGPAAPLAIPALAAGGGYLGGRIGQWAGGGVADAVAPRTPATNGSMGNGTSIATGGHMSPRNGSYPPAGGAPAPAAPAPAAPAPAAPAAAPPPAAPAGATGNLVSGLPKPTAPTPPPTQTGAKLESVNWKMNWNDYCVLTESDKSREKKARGY